MDGSSGGRNDAAKITGNTSSGEPGRGEAAEGAAFDAQRLADQFKVGLVALAKGHAAGVT